MSELSNNGIPILTGYGHILTDLVTTLTSKERREFGKYLGIFADNTLGLAYQRLNPDSPTLGFVSKASSLFFKLNCMEWWDSSFKSAMGLVLSNHLADHVNIRFNKLPIELQNQLTRYGINENNWGLYKHLKQKYKTDCNHYLIPDSSLIPEPVLSEYLAKLKLENTPLNIQNFKDDITNNLRRYYLDRVDTAVPTPHAAEKALITLGTKSGTGLGEAVRFFMQFKSFPITYVARPLNAATLGRIPIHLQTGNFTQDLAASLQNPGTITSMTHLLTGSTALGYVSLYSNALLEDKEPPSPAELKTWEAAAIKGGGLGIFSDFIFSEYDRYGRTFLQEAAGPIIGEVNSVASIITKYKQGKVTKAEDEAFKMFWRNVPGQNLFYLVPALRHYNLRP